MIKKILIMMMLISIAHTDVNSRMKSTYKPINMNNYSYHYSYSKTKRTNSYARKYFSLKKEHKKVVKLLEKAKKHIERMNYEIYKIRKKVESNRIRINTEINKRNEPKRKESIKKMRMNWKSNKSTNQ